MVNLGDLRSRLQWEEFKTVTLEDVNFQILLEKLAEEAGADAMF